MEKNTKQQIAKVIWQANKERKLKNFIQQKIRVNIIKGYLRMPYIV